MAETHRSFPSDILSPVDGSLRTLPKVVRCISSLESIRDYVSEYPIHLTAERFRKRRFGHEFSG